MSMPKRIVSLAVALLFPFLVAHAYVASSSNYRLQSDSVNNAGLLSTSPSYRLEDTAGEVGTGVGTSTSYQVKAGYQQMVVSGLSLTSTGAVTLLPTIPSVGGGAATGQASWTVITDNPAGYTMTIRAAGSPALVSGGNTFPDYVPAGAVPDFTFSTTSLSSTFGFSPEGSAITQRYLDNGASCNVGGGETANRCWDGLSTSDRLIAQQNVANNPSGTVTIVKFRAESGAAHIQPGGNYQATTTVTVLAR